MDGVPTDSPPAGGGRYRWIISFGIEGDLRFISHHDTLRMLRRALTRADLPVRYSEGFNPHPRISIPLPRPVGIASHDEAAVVETHRPMNPADALLRLQRSTPVGFQVQAVRPLSAGEPVQPVAATYLLETEGPPSEELKKRVNQFRVSDVAIVTRTDRESGRSRELDIRRSVERIDTEPRGVLFTLRMDRGGSAKPAEVAGAIGFDPTAINHRITRICVEWRQIQ